MTVLVTGAMGYIGSTLVPMLLRRSYNVIAVDNCMYGTESLIECARYTNFKFEKCDVRDIATLEHYVSQADIIIPLAAIVGAPACAKDPYTAASVNRDAALKLFKLVGTSQALLMPTTNSAYGTSLAGEVLTESSPLNPVSSYASGKIEVEQALLLRENSVSLRLATVFGVSPRMRTDLLVNDFVYRAYKDNILVLFEAHFMRNYIHVVDVARCFLHAIDNFDEFKGNIFNVGQSSANVSKLGLAELIREHLPSLLIIQNCFAKDPDQRNYFVSNDKLESTGFRAKYSIDDGVRELLRLYAMITDRRYSNI